MWITATTALLRPRCLAWVACLAVLLFFGCALPPPAVQGGSCPTTRGARLLQYELFFGRNVADHREVNDRAWDDFLAQVVTPNLPNGYTVFDATGHWRSPATGHTVDERTKVMLTALPDTPDSAAAIARIRQRYEAAFGQSLVGMAVVPVCGEF